MSSPTLEEEITSGFSTLDEDLYDAAIMDELSLKDLVSRLAGLNERVQSTQAFSKGLLRPRTIALIRSVTSRARILARNMMNVHRATDEITAKRGNQIAEVLAKMSLRDSDKNATKISNGPKNPTTVSSPSVTKANPVDAVRSAQSPGTSGAQRPPLLLNVFAWLVVNMHNPYPSVPRKTLIAASNRSSIKSVNNSLETARRRSGWTKVLRKHFGGNRALAVDCAHRVFISSDPNYPVSDLIRQDLLDVKVEAERIYAEMLRQHNLSESACEIIDAISSKVPGNLKVNASGGSSPCLDKVPGDRESSTSETHSSSLSMQTDVQLAKVSRRTSSLSNGTVTAETRELSELASTGSLRVKASKERKLELNQGDDEAKQDGNLGMSRPCKRKRRASQASSGSSDISKSSVSTPDSILEVLPTVASPNDKFEVTHLSPILDGSDLSFTDVQYCGTATSIAGKGRKRCISATEITCAPTQKRRRDASYASSFTSSTTAGSSSPQLLYPDFPSAEYNSGPGTSTGICDLTFLTDAAFHGSISGLDPSLTNPAMNGSTCFPNDFGAFQVDWSEFSGTAPDTAVSCKIGSTPCNFPETCTDETGDVSDGLFDLVASGEQASVAGDPWAISWLENSGRDFANFPAMPDFSDIWTDIPPPTLDPFSLPSHLFPATRNDAFAISNNCCSVQPESAVADTSNFLLPAFEIQPVNGNGQSSTFPVVVHEVAG